MQECIIASSSYVTSYIDTGMRFVYNVNMLSRIEEEISSGTRIKCSLFLGSYWIRLYIT